MKIEKTEMEFVAFDAQDVIVTSGGLKTSWFTVSQSLFSLPGVELDEYDGDGSWRYGTLGQALVISEAEGSWAGNDGAMWKLTEGTSGIEEGDVARSLDGEAHALSIYGAEQISKAGDPAKELKSLLDIFNWLSNPQ